MARTFPILTTREIGSSDGGVDIYTLDVANWLEGESISDQRVSSSDATEVSISGVTVVETTKIQFTATSESVGSEGLVTIEVEVETSGGRSKTFSRTLPYKAVDDR